MPNFSFFKTFKKVLRGFSGFHQLGGLALMRGKFRCTIKNCDKRATLTKKTNKMRQTQHAA
jgi:hypothetical protein